MREKLNWQALFGTNKIPIVAALTIILLLILLSVFSFFSSPKSNTVTSPETAATLVSKPVPTAIPVLNNKYSSAEEAAIQGFRDSHKNWYSYRNERISNLTLSKDGNSANVAILAELYRPESKYFWEERKIEFKIRKINNSWQKENLTGYSLSSNELAKMATATAAATVAAQATATAIASATVSAVKKDLEITAFTFYSTKTEGGLKNYSIALVFENKGDNLAVLDPISVEKALVQTKEGKTFKADFGRNILIPNNKTGKLVIPGHFQTYGQDSLIEFSFKVPESTEPDFLKLQGWHQDINLKNLANISSSFFGATQSERIPDLTTAEGQVLLNDPQGISLAFTGECRVIDGMGASFVYVGVNRGSTKGPSPRFQEPTVLSFLPNGFVKVALGYSNTYSLAPGTKGYRYHPLNMSSSSLNGKEFYAVMYVQEKLQPGVKLPVYKVKCTNGYF